MYGAENSYKFYEMEVSKSNGDKIELADFEGYVFLYVVVPLTSGMADYYYAMLEHLGSLAPYQYSVASAILPIGDRDGVVSELQPKAGSKTIVLETRNSLQVNIKEYIDESDILLGPGDKDLSLDRATVFIFSSDGLQIQQLSTPTLAELKVGIEKFFKEKDLRDVRKDMMAAELWLEIPRCVWHDLKDLEAFFRR